MAGAVLVGVHDAGFESLHRMNVAARVRGDAAHPLHEVERDTLGPEYAGRRPAHNGDVISGGERCAVLQDGLDLQGGIDPLEDSYGHIYPGQHSCGFSAQHAGALDLRRDHGLGCGVVERLVFGDRGIDQRISVGGRLGQGKPSLLSIKNRDKSPVNRQAPL